VQVGRTRRARVRRTDCCERKDAGEGERRHRASPNSVHTCPHGGVREEQKGHVAEGSQRE